MKDFWVNLLLNFSLISAACAMSLAQIIKVIVYLIKEKKLNFGHLLEAGGMPSAHSGAVSALMISVALSNGVNSPVFAAVVVFGLIVMYDAAGVRRAASEQALVLNKITKHLNFTNELDSYEKLKEILGHTPFEVAVGAILGILTTLMLYLFFYI